MAVITVRNLPDAVHRALRIRAAMNGISTEAEVRRTLEDAVSPEPRLKLGSVLQRLGQQLQLDTEPEIESDADNNPEIPEQAEPL